MMADVQMQYRIREKHVEREHTMKRIGKE